MTKEEIMQQVDLTQQKVSSLKKQISETEILLKIETLRLKSLDRMLKTNRNMPTNREYSTELKLVLQTKTIQIGLYELNASERTLSLKGKKQHITIKEAQLLAVLASNTNKLLTRTYLLNTIWSDNTYHAGRSMDVYLCKLRKLLIDDSSINIINYHGKGYKLSVM